MCSSGEKIPFRKSWIYVISASVNEWKAVELCWWHLWIWGDFQLRICQLSRLSWAIRRFSPPLLFYFTPKIIPNGATILSHITYLSTTTPTLTMNLARILHPFLTLFKLCQHLLLAPSIAHCGKTLLFVQKIGLRIWLNTFVPNSNISQIRLKSKFKTTFYDSKSKFWNVILQTFHWEMYLKFTP